MKAKPQEKFEFPQMDPDNRMRELILYISAKCAEDLTFGATKLNKILWYSDFLAYLARGKPVTGSAYRRLQYGPVPAHIERLRTQMIRRRELAIEPRPYMNRIQERPVALRGPTLGEFFKLEDMEIVDDVIRKLWGRAATLINEGTHLHKCWSLVDDKELISYDSAFLADNDEITDEDIVQTRELAVAHGWE